jgi:NAD(P)-dependent dehydrogenase (short-subunit alcohol dehydrogenase family)
LSDKVAIITAGGSGIGAAAARRLASDGFRVAIFDTSDKAEALAKELGGFAVTGSNQSNDDLMLIFPSHGFVITPLSTGLRIGGAVEFAGLRRPPTSRAPRRCFGKPRRSCRNWTGGVENNG